MGFKMLLGREAMIDKMIIDPSKLEKLVDYDEDQIISFYKIEKKNASGYKIGLLASNKDLYSNRRIMESGFLLGHEMVFLNVQHCYMKMDAETPEIHYRGGNIFSMILMQSYLD